MYTGESVFSQLIDFQPMYEFRNVLTDTAAIITKQFLVPGSRGEGRLYFQGRQGYKGLPCPGVAGCHVFSYTEKRRADGAVLWILEHY
jgi:hypothetical protein